MTTNISPPPVIAGFTGPYHFLSNFYIEPDGTHVEGEYQAHKTIPTSLTLLKMRPGDAKRAGAATGMRIRGVKLRDDWETIKHDIMAMFIRHKFTDHPSLLAALIATGDADLVEANWWHDNHYGACGCEACKDKPKHNILGVMLMQIRRELRVRRADKSTVCLLCSETYERHPFDLMELSYDGQPYLHVLCNHERVKL